MKNNKIFQSSKFKRILLIPTLLIFTVVACDFKSQVEAEIKGDGGKGVLKVEVVAGAEFKTKGKITERTCEEVGYGNQIVVASCDVVANVTRRVKNSSGGFEEEIRQETHTLEYKVACVPGTEWEIDCSDPVILQIPKDWSITKATFKGDNGIEGDLSLEDFTPFADVNKTPYIAEPGYKLVVLGFPYGTPESLYDIDIEWKYTQLGIKEIKAIYAAAVHYIDPHNGEVHMYFPPAAPAEYNFAKIQDPFYIAEVTAAHVSARQLSEGEKQSFGLPEADQREYVALSLNGADPKDIDLKALLLAMEQ